MKKLFKSLGICFLALPVLLALTGNPSQAATASGITALTVNLKPFVILYYPTSLKINLADILTSTGVDTLNNVVLTEGGSLDANITVPAAGTVVSERTLTILKAWAVRGLTSTGEAEIDITPSLTLDHASGGSLPVTLTVTTDQGTGDTNVAQTLKGMSAQYGSINMTFDLANLGSATQAFSGDYGSTNYTITVDGT